MGTIAGKDHMMAMIGIFIMAATSFLAMIPTQVWITWTFALMFSVGLTITLTFVSAIASKAAGDSQGTILSLVDFGKNVASAIAPKMAQSIIAAGHLRWLPYIS